MNSKEIGKRLKELRGNRTQNEVAESLGISFSSYTKYEQGIRVPRDELKVSIAKFYKKSVQELFF